ncbi:serine/threonine-protein kinase [Roseiconus nitratireducens]|nr:serine/threonine-protein kinase [Roseiconus nitratireducens]
MADFQPASDSPTTDGNHFAETRLWEPDDTISRQEEDIAFAAELMRSGIASEREIAANVSDWSIHGNVSLAEHLQKRSFLKPEQIDSLRQLALQRVDGARMSAAGGSEFGSGSGGGGQSLLLATLERLDGSGRVAKLLGVTVASRGGEQDARVMEGRYELIRKIGQGGLGRVWLARDVNLNRYVALKEISRSKGVSDAVVQRFKHEAEITGRLDHPSIVPIYQLGEDVASKRLFYAMRFLGRSTLEDSIIEYHERREDGDEDPMLLRHLLTAFVNVCHAIGYAHSRKVIHRDLKPENVVIDSFGQVIVIDWGLAKVVDETSVESLMDSGTIGSGDRTAEGQVLGTPLYMAPEQAAGRLDELDYRTDIYGLGAILFAIVSGHAPHEKTQRDSVNSGVGARGMISVIAGGETPSAREASSSVDPALDAVCRKAMARRRYARYQRATDLGEDVQRWMAGEPVTAYRENHWQRVNRWVSSHQRLTQFLIAAAMVVLVVLTTMAMTARQNRLAALHTRFSQMNGDVRELQIQLRGVATELSRDVRFTASLPPIEGIIAARNGQEGEDEETWRERLQTIFTGMLRSNPDYLTLGFEAMKNGGDAEDIVRVERNPAYPSLIRVLPQSRLKTIESDPLADQVALLEPGDVKLSLEPRKQDPIDSFGLERLIVATPVFSGASGECFGMTVIEADISTRVQEVLAGLGTLEYELFVADGEGQVWAMADPERGVRMAASAQKIPDLPEAVAEKLMGKPQPFELHVEDQYIARRFYVDPTGRGVLLFGRLHAE